MMFNSNRSLTATTMLSMGLRISVVIVVAALLSYLHIVQNLESKTLDELKKYISERTAKESKIFQLAEDNHDVFSDSFLQLWEQRQNASAQLRFEQLFEPYEQGTYKLKQDVFDGKLRSDKSENSYYMGQTKWISGFVGKNTPISDPNFLNRLLLSYDLVDRFAEGWSNRFANTYVSLPEGVNIVYWPELNWAEGASPDLDIPNEEWVYIANIENNPERKSVWTGLYYDQTADHWMVSCETPVDAVNGQHLINVGHDILLDKLFERVFNDHLPGAYNYIFRDDGRLIAHPDYVASLEKTLGLINVKETGSKALVSQFETILAAASQNAMPQIVEATLSSGEEAYFAFSRIEGPDWFFVTAYPKKLLSSMAKSSAEFILILGVLSLIIEMFMLYLVLNKKVITPLSSFNLAAKELSQNNFSIKSIFTQAGVMVRSDEIGRLSHVFVDMAQKLQHYQDHLEDEVNKRTIELDKAREKAEEEARTDVLTGLNNRRAFFEFSEYALAQVKRYQIPLTLVMLDIDHFKKVNDNFGHPVGDEVLKFIASLLKINTRPTDILARLGGEEFVILMHDCDFESALKVAESLRQHIQEKCVHETDIDLAITASFGVASMVDTTNNIEDLLKSADTALYKAKQNGRNRVEGYIDAPCPDS